MKSKEKDFDIPVQFGVILMIDALGVSSYTIDQCKQFFKLQEQLTEERGQLKNEEFEICKADKKFHSICKDFKFNPIRRYNNYLLVNSTKNESKLSRFYSFCGDAS